MTEEEEQQHETDVAMARLAAFFGNCPELDMQGSHGWDIDNHECVHCKAPYPWPEAPR